MTIWYKSNINFVYWAAHVKEHWYNCKAQIYSVNIGYGYIILTKSLNVTEKLIPEMHLQSTKVESRKRTTIMIYVSKIYTW